LTIDEVRQLLKDPSISTLRDLAITAGAPHPEIVYTSALERHHAGELWFWCAPRLFSLASENLIVGSGCFKNSPRDGAVEIGCGVAESYTGRNIATEGVKLLVVEGFSKLDVTAITAETAVWNLASQRVLEKASFIRTGSRVDDEDGPVITWRLERAI
jgi:RimJ/RimL family protein N-acetyltransferase